MTEEDKLQRAVIKFLTLKSGNGRNFRFFHVPNGGLRNYRVARKFKLLGVRPGAPDLLLNFPGGITVEIELKTSMGRLTPAQKAWALKSKQLGFKHYVCRTLEAVEEVLRLHLVSG